MGCLSRSQGVSQSRIAGCVKGPREETVGKSWEKWSGEAPITTSGLGVEGGLRWRFVKGPQQRLMLRLRVVISVPLKQGLQCGHENGGAHRKCLWAVGR